VKSIVALALFRAGHPGAFAVAADFVDETSAVCWRYSPADRTFVRVGEWVT